jgi:hypothetical protein
VGERGRGGRDRVSIQFGADLDGLGWPDRRLEATPVASSCTVAAGRKEAERVGKGRQR